MCSVLSRFTSRLVEKENGCLEFQGSRTPAGYGRFFIGKKQALAHRFAWEAKNPPLNEGETVEQVACKNPACCNVDHMAVVSQKSVMSRRKPGGNYASGERNGHFTKPYMTPRGQSHGRSKLRESDVLGIRYEHIKEGKSGNQIAKARGLSVSHVCEILSGKSWSHLQAAADR